MVRFDRGGEEKKLTGAVDHWFNGADDGAALLEDLRAYGSDASSLPARFRRPAEFEVWPEHQDAVLLFLKAQTQWRAAPMGGVMGLDYGAVAWLLTLYPVREPQRVVEDLQVMEARAKELINAEAGKAAKAPAKGRRRR